MTNNDDVVKCVSIDGILINLNAVSHDLRRSYDLATAAAARGERARDRLSAVGKQILAEQLPALAIKHAPKAHGAAGFFNATRGRAR